MDCTERRIERRFVVGVSDHTDNLTEGNAHSARIPALWRHFFEERLYEKVEAAAPPGHYCGVYSDYESDVNGRYRITAGVEVHGGTEPPAGCVAVEIQAGKYLVWEVAGPMPQAAIETWIEIWDFFSTNGSYRRAYTSDFEIYKGRDEVCIHISIE